MHINDYCWDTRRRTGRISLIGVMRRSIGITVHDGVVSVVKIMGSWGGILVNICLITYCGAQHFQKDMIEIYSK